MNEHSTMFKTEEKHLAFFDLPPNTAPPTV